MWFMCVLALRLELEQEGPLFRQGRFFKSTWAAVHAAVSKTGFFHIFENAENTSPDFAVQLKECTVELAPAIHPNAFSISQPSTSMFSFGGSSKQYFKAQSEESMVTTTILTF